MAAGDRQKREKDELRERILASARAIVHEEGYEAVTIRKIAARIEYSPMALYNHFPDKNAILMALAREVFARLEGSLPKPGKDPLATLRKAGHAYIRFGLEHPEEYRLIFMQPYAPSGKASDDDSAMVPDNTGGRAAFERLTGLVAACCSAGLFAGDPFKLATAIWAGIHGVVALQITLTAFPYGRPGELATNVVDLLLAGLTQRTKG